MDYSNPNEVFERELGRKTADEEMADFNAEFAKAQRDFDAEFARTSKMIDRTFRGTIIAAIVLGTLSIITIAVAAFVVLHFVLKAW